MDGAGVECCCVCLVPFKGKLNYFTMLCLQRLQDSWAALSPYLLQPTEGLTLETLQTFTSRRMLDLKVQMIIPDNKDYLKIYNFKITFCSFSMLYVSGIQF